MADTIDEDDDKPLDPAAARVQQRLRRLMLISSLTLGIGIFAVFGAIVFRLMTSEAPAPAPLAEDAATPTIALSVLGLSPDARLISSALDGDRLALSYTDDDGITVVIFDTRSMAVIGRLRVDDE
ncbi:hypothetical protein [Bauldia sp.]|uniref:hypothetical protein n=1 Tax=Bauldia sp. TaxID=2575872 RepID=UPI003BAC7093